MRFNVQARGRTKSNAFWSSREARIASVTNLSALLKIAFLDLNLQFAIKKIKQTREIPLQLYYQMDQIETRQNNFHDNERELQACHYIDWQAPDILDTR